MTYYELLEISEKASPEVIRMAYKALCKKYHPDIYQGDKKFAEEKMKQLNEAYEVLSDATKKRQYDASLSSQRPHQQSSYQPRQESYSPPRQKPPRQQNSSFSITMLLASGFVALKDGNWALADSFFNEVISFDPTRADAYLGKLMVELRVRTKEDLKNCKEPFNYKLYYQKAFSLADDSLKQFLKETIQHINNRNYEQKCSSTYHYACSLMHLANKVKDFENAIAEFEKIRKYKDSAKKIDECYKKIAEINSAILAAKAEKEKRAKERKEKLITALPLFKKIAIVVVPMLLITIVAATILPRINWDKANAVNDSSNLTNSTSNNLNNGSKEIKNSSKETQSDGTYIITDYNSASQIIYKSSYSKNDTKISIIDYQFDSSGECYTGFIESQFYENGTLSFYREAKYEAGSISATSFAKSTYSEYYNDIGEIHKIIEVENEFLQHEYNTYVCAKTVLVYHTKDKILAEKFVYQNSFNNGELSIVETHSTYDNDGTSHSEIITNKGNTPSVW